MGGQLAHLKRQNTTTLGTIGILAHFRHFHRICLVVITLLTLSACGYRFPGGGLLPGGVEEVAVGVFYNRSGEVGVEGIISNDIIDILNEFGRTGKGANLGSETAQATLSGTVLSVTTNSISRESVHTVAERRVTVAISLELVDSDGAVIWQVSQLSENEEYEVEADKAATEMNKREAISKLSERLAEKAYYKMTDDF